MAYNPKLAPTGKLQFYLQREFDNIAEEFRQLNTNAIIFAEHTSIPDKPVEGMIINFNASVHGTAGLYQYIGGVWISL